MSILLASIIAGAAIVVAVAQCFEGATGGRFIVQSHFVCQAGVVVITTLRFFHGNAMWYSWRLVGGPNPRPLHPTQEAITRLLGYYVHTGQYLLFFAAARSVGSTETFLWLMFWISAVDVLWTGVNWLSEGDSDLRHALGSWFLLNCGCAGALLVAIYGSSEERIICYGVAAVYGAAALVDYLVNRKLFFGVDDSSG